MDSINRKVTIENDQNSDRNVFDIEKEFMSEERDTRLDRLENKLDSLSCDLQR